jgi:signal transduction histidine kinase
MRLPDWLRPPRQLMVVFLVVALASTGVLAWLTLQLLAQDRAADQQRQRERLEQVADSATSDVARRLASLERHLDAATSGIDPLPAGTMVVSWDATGLKVSPAGGLLYRPITPSSSSLVSDRLAEAERLELASGDLEAAARAYTAIATGATSRPLQAAAWLRVARVHRKLNAHDAALAAYDGLATFDGLLLDGLPAALVARVGRASIFERANDQSSLRLEASRLSTDLQSGSLPVTRSQYDYYSSEAARWLGAAPASDADALARADAVTWLWARRAELLPRDRRLQVFSGGPVLLSWNTTQGGATGLVLVAGPQAIGALASATMPPRIEWAMTDSEGRLVAGQGLPARGATSRASATTGLPWTLHVFEPIGYTPPAGSSRRRLLLFVIASVATLLAIGWYFIWRGVSREVRLARLQSDFVAAVSHEFRSPLTSLRHIGDLLAENRLPSEEQKQRSYAVLTHETDRLGRLVESLLDFARFESGSAVLRLSPASIADVVRSVVADFQIRPDAGSRSMVVPDSLPALMVNIDRDAVARALWNLLDNAVKYSPRDSTIWIGVSATADGRSACVSVRDEGIGIPSHEQRTVFDRFVRGREATFRRIQGTGIGLALVRELMRAHHGSVAVESEPGAGSTFTLVLPQAGDVEPHAASSHNAGLLAGVSGRESL